MTIRERGRAGLARQLGHPRGVVGRLVARRLNRYNSPRIAAAVEALDLAPGAVAADIGFGGGVGLRLLLDQVGPDGRVHGVDISKAMVARARRRLRREVSTGRLRVHTGSIDALPLPGSILDGAISINTVYFLADLPAAFAELRRVLRPGGCLALGVGEPEAMAQMPVTAHGFRLRPIVELTEALTAAGLTVEEDRRFDDKPPVFHLLICRR